MAVDKAQQEKLQKEFRLAQQAGGVKGGQKYIAGNVREIAGQGGQYQQPGQKQTDPRLGGNMMGGYGSPGVTGAKGGGGGYIGMGNPQQIAALHANPQLTQQLYGFTPQSVQGSIGQLYPGHKTRADIEQGQRDWQAQQSRRVSGGGMAPPMGGQGGGMPGGQGLAGGGLSGTINQTLQRLLGGGGQAPGQAPGQFRQFTGGGSTGGAPVGTRGAFGAPQQAQQGQQQQGQFPTNALEAQQAGQVAQQLRSEEQAIREDFGRRGQAGSPAMEAALRQARDRASQGRSQGLQQLQVSAYGQNREQREADRNALMRALQLALSATGQSQGMQQQQMQNMLNMFGG